MTTLSQKSLLKQARQNVAAGKLEAAIQNLEEALRDGPDQELVLLLCQLYCQNEVPEAAYTLIKEEHDLFSDPAVLDEYRQVLILNHFAIEALQVAYLSKQEIIIAADPVSETEQQQIMTAFKAKQQPSQHDYQQLLKLSLLNFTNFAQSLLLDPSLNFAVRIALCEDLVRLGLTKKMRVLVLGKQEDFIPSQTKLLTHEPLYREIVSGIGSRYYQRPNQLPTVLAEVNLILGSLYPMINEYVDEPDSFVSDIASYIDHHDGRSNHRLFETIELNLPK